MFKSKTCNPHWRKKYMGGKTQCQFGNKSYLNLIILLSAFEKNRVKQHIWDGSEPEKRVYRTMRRKQQGVE